MQNSLDPSRECFSGASQLVEEEQLPALLLAVDFVPNFAV